MFSILKKILFKIYISKNYRRDSSDVSARKSFEKNLDYTPLKKPNLTSPAQIINKRITELNSLNKTNADIMIDSDLPKSTFNRIISDFQLNYLPKKENLIKLAIGLEYNLSQTLELLNLYGYTLSNSSMLDVTCSFFFTNWKYHDKDRGTAIGISELQSLLSDWTNIDIMER